MCLTKFYNILKPKMGNYGNFYLPLSYSKYNTKDVVINTRKLNHMTFFDVSHMGLFETKINDLSIKNLSNLLNINVSKILPNKSKLCVILNKKGHVTDDLILSNINNEKLRLVVNANNKNFFKKIDFLEEKNKYIFALQGSGTQKILENLYNTNLNNVYFMENTNINNIELSRCGYTGEDGFEIYLDKNQGYNLFDDIINLSFVNDKINFGGLIARDILRIEAGLNLSGTEFNENMNIKFNALNMNFLIDRDFRNQNKDILKSNNKQQLFYSNKPINSGIIYTRHEAVGFVTSTTKSFNIDKFIAIGYLNLDVNLENKFYIKDKRNRHNEIIVHHGNFLDTKYYKKK